MPSPVLYIIAAVLLISGPLAAQQIWVVDAAAGAGSNFTDIAPAVAVATDGDVILVRSGNYTSFTITQKSLAITADLGAACAVSGTVTIQNLTISQWATLRGLNIQGAPAGLNLQNDTGGLWIEGCNISGANGVDTPGFYAGGSAAVAAHCDNCILLQCVLTGGFGVSAPMTTVYADGAKGGTGLDADHCNLVLYDCQSKGRRGGDAGVTSGFTTNGGAGGNGAQCTNSTVFASGTLFRGGGGGAGVDSAPFPSFCGFGGNGGNGIWLAGSSFNQFTNLNCTFFGGAAGISQGGSQCSANPPSPGVGIKTTTGTITNYPGTSRSFTMPSPVREQQNLTLQFSKGAPGEEAFIVFSNGAAPFSAPSLLGILLPDLLTIDAFDAGVVPGNGTLTTVVALGPLPPTVQASVFFVQSIFVDFTTGNAILGAASELTILDSAY